MDVIAGLFQVYETRKKDDEKKDRRVRRMSCFGKPDEKKNVLGILPQLCKKQEMRQPHDTRKFYISPVIARIGLQNKCLQIKKYIAI